MCELRANHHDHVPQELVSRGFGDSSMEVQVVASELFWIRQGFAHPFNQRFQLFHGGFAMVARNAGGSDALETNADLEQVFYVVLFRNQPPFKNLSQKLLPVLSKIGRAS